MAPRSQVGSLPPSLGPGTYRAHGAATPNPAFVTLGRAFGITPVQASYQLVVYLVFSGVGPLFVVPFASATGRRPIMVAGSLLAAVTNIIASYCATWTGIVVTRAINGFAVGATVALGPAVICEMYFLHERGLYMGIFALFLNNGPHIAPLFGGFVTRSLGWRYCFAIPVGYLFLWELKCFANVTDRVISSLESSSWYSSASLRASSGETQFSTQDLHPRDHFLVSSHYDNQPHFGRNFIRESSWHLSK